jgi:uncharacterized protein (TIGR02145 family)
MKRQSLFSVIICIVSLLLSFQSCKKDNSTSLPTPVPILTTNDVNRVSDTHGISGGWVSDAGGKLVTASGVCWSTSPGPTINDSKTEDYYTNTGYFISYFSGLTPNMVYYLRAYATTDNGTGYGNEIKFKTLPDYDGQTGTVTDVDGNVYNTIGIGGQLWMAENLKTTSFNDGTPIPLKTDDAAWSALTSPGYCFWGNDNANVALYGNLYNWYTIDSSSNGNRNVCPDGWHVPSNNDYVILRDFLKEICAGKWSFDMEATCGDIPGRMLKEEGTIHWNSPNVATNSTGFNALPGATRYENGFYDLLGNYGSWWSSTIDPYNNGYSGQMSLHNSSGMLDLYGGYTWASGLSIRCLKN